MNEYTDLLNYLNEAFSVDNTELTDMFENLSKIQQNISKLEENLSDLDNYRRENDGSAFFQELLNSHNNNIKNIENNIMSIEDNIEETKGVIGLANDEISNYNNQINAINENIKELINEINYGVSNERSIEIQHQIRQLIHEKNVYISEIDHLSEDRQYFKDSLKNLEQDLTNEQFKLNDVRKKFSITQQEFSNSKVNIEAFKSDNYELERLKKEASSINKYIEDLSILDEFNRLVKNNTDKEYDSNELYNILKKVQEINLSDSQMDDLKNQLSDTENQIKEIKERLGVLGNYEYSSNNDLKIAKYRQLINISNNNLKDVETLLETLENRIEPLKKNRQIQEEIKQQISDLSRQFREDSSNDEYYQEQFKGFYQTLDQLKSEEEKLIANFNELDYKKEKEQLLNRKQRINENILKYESLMADNKYKGYNRFKINEDKIRLANLKNKLQRLEKIYNVFTKTNDITANLKVTSEFNDSDYTNLKDETSNLNNLNNKSNFDLPGADFQFNENDDEINEKGIAPYNNYENFKFDFTPDTDQVKKIKGIKKSNKWEKIKSLIKGNLKKVIAITLVGVATISGVNSLINKEIDDKQNINSKTVMNLSNQTKEDLYTDIASDILKENNIANASAITNEYYDIGDNVNLVGDSIYSSSIDASNSVNALNPYYSKNDQRSISAIQYVSPDGSQHVTITKENQDQAETLENMGWKVEAYCTNNDTQNLTYEGWYNTDDLEVSDGKYR